jgi:hypothetical protein
MSAEQSISDAELALWAERRADDAGRLARELVIYRRASLAGYRLVGPGEVEAIERQFDNMAFVLNHAPLPENIYQKFLKELEADRAALSSSIPAMPNSQDGHTESRDREGGV